MISDELKSYSISQIRSATLTGPISYGKLFLSVRTSIRLGREGRKEDQQKYERTDTKVLNNLHSCLNLEKISMHSKHLKQDFVLLFIVTDEFSKDKEC